MKPKDAKREPKGAQNEPKATKGEPKDNQNASKNDHFVALTMLKNASISASGVLPMCQDTGTAIIMGYKGEKVFTGEDDGKFLSLGVYNTYQKK